MNSAPRTAVDVVEQWSPPGVSAAVVAATRATVALASSPSALRARSLLYAAGRFFSFAEALGTAPSASLLSRTSLIERCVHDGLRDCSVATRRTVRANLRLLARVAVPIARPPAIERGRAKAPYSPAELAQLFALSSSQPTLARRHKLTAVLCLGAGAGLIGRELRAVTGRDVIERSGGVVVTVSGPRARVVPVRAEYHRRLLAVARSAPDGLLCGGSSPDRKNVTAGLRHVAGGIDLPPIETGRLRSTWLLAEMEDLGLAGLLEGAGLTCPQRLGDLLPWCAPLSEAELVGLLGGRRRR